MFLNSRKNKILSVGLIFSVVTAEIGPYALDKFHIPHLDSHNHPRETTQQTSGMGNIFAIGTSASATASTGDFYRETFVTL